MRSLDQERAEYAFEVVKEVSQDNGVLEKYSSYVKSAPALIMTSGLLGTLIYYLSKVKMKPDLEIKKEEIENLKKPEEKAYAYLYLHIREWLEKNSRVTKDLVGGKNLIHYMLEEADALQVLLFTREALNLINWIKMFSDALLEGGEE